MTGDEKMLQHLHSSETPQRARYSPDDPFMTNRQAALFLSDIGLPVSEKSLPSMRCRGGDVPPFHRFGRRVLYRKSDLVAWVQSRTGAPQRNTSDRKAG